MTLSEDVPHTSHLGVPEWQFESFSPHQNDSHAVLWSERRSCVLSCPNLALSLFPWRTTCSPWSCHPINDKARDQDQVPMFFFPVGSSLVSHIYPSCLSTWPTHSVDKLVSKLLAPVCPSQIPLNPIQGYLHHPLTYSRAELAMKDAPLLYLAFSFRKEELYFTTNSANTWPQLSRVACCPPGLSS